MRWIHLDPVGGIAGDMTLAALFDLGVPVEGVREGLEALRLPPFSLELERVQIGALFAARLEVRVGGDAPPRDWKSIRVLLREATLPPRVRRRALATFEALAVAEGKVHGVSPEEVHFHEVGAVDALVDIVGVGLALEHLGVEGLSASPPPLGRGLTHSAHGPIPIPAPATLALLEGLSCVGTENVGEMVTPTGAALLRTLCEGRVGAMPAMRLERSGHGAGKARWADRPNLLRATLGEREVRADDDASVWVLETNLDDLSPELLAACTEALFEAGALDVWVAPIVMKKGRPGHLLSALCRPGERDVVAEAMLRHSASFGLRFHPVNREELDRSFESVETPHGEVQVKVGRRQGEVMVRAPEFEACAALARAQGVPVREVHAAAVAAAASVLRSK